MDGQAPAIAVVGMACRYPDASDPNELWTNVLAARRAFRRISDERLPLADYGSADSSDPDRTYATHAGLIEGYEFDRLHYRVSAQAHAEADAAHWLALDVAARAIEDAGFGGGRPLPKDTTAVIVGNTLTGEFSRANLLRLRWPYVRRAVDRRLAAIGWEAGARGAFLGEVERDYKAPFPAVGTESLAGALSNTIAGRICNHFDLHGGGYTVDAACAASLLAVINGCSGLLTGDFDLVVAGGVDLSLDPFELVGFARLGALARSMMRVYDQRSEGFWPGEGSGFVVLTRLADAVALGMRPYAVIRGWGLSSDGSGGITRPEPDGQRLALERAYARAGYGIDSVAYFEGHGTGTPVGDRVEVTALLRARGAGDAAVPAVLGSIKANVGHTKAAAGVAGLIKAVLAVHTQVLPPTTGCEQPLAELDSASALVTTREPRGWAAEHPLRASVSAMGFGGVNTHITLEGLAGDRRRGRLTALELEAGCTPQDAELFAFAAESWSELAAQVERVAGVASGLSLAELADAAGVTAAALRPGQLRAAVVAGSADELAAHLDVLLEAIRAKREGGSTDGVHLNWARERPRIGYLFPGQASPPHQDGGALRRRFPAAAEVYGSAALEAGVAETDTATVQPAIVTGSMAALAVLADLGLRADIALGHSLGELTAYHWAGVLTGDELLGTARARGAAMAAVEGKGAMLSVSAPAATVEPLLPSGVVIACLNSPRQTIVAGEPAALDRMAEAALAMGLACSRLPVSHAFHSPQMRGAVAGLEQQLERVCLRPATRRLVSSITGRLLEAADDTRGLMITQLTSPVRFVSALEAIRAEAELLVEVGPGQVVSRLATDVLGARVYAVNAGDGSLRDLLEFLAAAHVAGAGPDLKQLFRGRRLKALDLSRRGRFFINPCESGPPTEPDPPRVTTGADTRPPAPAADPAAEPLDVVMRLVCARLQLPASAVQSGHRFLSDLHLNSITVAQLMADAAQGLARQPPRAGLDFADASLQEAADALATLPEAGGAEEVGEAPGAADWVRLFAVELVPVDLEGESMTAAPAGWTLACPDSHPLAGALAAMLPDLPGHGALVVVGDGAPEAVFERLRTGSLGISQGSVIFLQESDGARAGGFARSLFLEAPESTVKVVGVPAADERAAVWVRAEAGAGEGFVEAVYDSPGRRCIPVLRASERVAASPPPLGPEDVILVSGGGKGIGAEAALALARRARCRVALLGRSDPTVDAELAANLERFASSGLDYRYYRADVTDGAAVRTTVAAAAAALGPVTALLHAAGSNQPRLLKDLDTAQAAAVIAPKCAGLDNLLAALEPDRLRLLLGFGSVIARSGLRGEAHYAFANEWMRSRIERYAERHVACQSLCIEWSVWSGVGMGERLGTVQALRAMGVSPISLEQGLAALEDALELGAGHSSVVATGRLGGLSTVAFDPTPPPFLRFLEEVRVSYPGVELVAEAEVGLATDTYLQHHALGQELLLPAVLGLEAMAQAASAIVGGEGPTAFEQVSFSRPLLINRGGVNRVRVAATAREPKIADTVVRAAATGFQVDHFRARCRRGPGPVPLLPPPASPGRPVDLNPGRDLYGSLFFQSGPFRRVLGYSHLSAFGCTAQIAGVEPTGWFARHLPADLMLGDPGARDAALHALQACLPGVVVLPVAVEEIRVEPAGGAGGPLQLRSVERTSDRESFTWDLELRDGTGTLIETWRGLRLQRVEDRAVKPDWPPALLAAALERQFHDVLGAHPQLEVRRDGAGHPSGSRARNGHAHGGARRRDGKPDADPRHASAAHASHLTLAISSDDPVACDLEPVDGRRPDAWSAILGRTGLALARTIAEESGEVLDVAATRAWSAGEALKKLGRPAETLVLNERRGSGLVSFRAGPARVDTLLLPATDSGAALVATVARLNGDA